MVEKEFLDDVIVLIDTKAKSIVTKENGAFPYDEVIEPYLDKYGSGDKVNLTIYGEPPKIHFIKKSGEFKTKKPEAPKPIKDDKSKKELGYVHLNGKWYATLEVLLNKLHESYPGRHRIKTEPIHIDYEKQEAMFKATIEIIDDEGRVMGEYHGVGDANKTNVNSNILTAFPRMAETRAIVRAMRWATNIAETSIDEMPSYDKSSKGFKGKTTLA